MCASADGDCGVLWGSGKEGGIREKKKKKGKQGKNISDVLLVGPSMGEMKAFGSVDWTDQM